MRVAVLSSWWPSPPVNGAKLRAWHLLRELAQRHEVSLYSFAETGEAQPDDIAPLRQWCREVQIVPGNPHKPSRRLSWRGYFGSMPRSYAQTFTPAMADAVARVGGKVDAMVALEIGTAVYCGGNGTRPRVPWIFEEAEGTIIHDQTASADGVLTQWRRQLTWRKYAAFVGRLIARAARTTVVSEVERHCLADAGCDQSRMSVLPNGVDEAYLAIDAPKQPDTLIYAGSLSYGPNLDAVRWFVTDILPRVRAVRPSVSLVVTGRHDGVPLAPLMREGVTFTGHVPDVASHVAGSAIAVVPLRIGGGTRLKVLEAMALGTPVVSTAKGAEGLDVRDQQHLLIADAPDAFARRVLDLLEQPARAREIAAHARQRIADRYTWRRIGLQLDALLRDAVRDHHAALRS